MRAYLAFSGLPAPDVNAPVYDGAREIGIVDLLYRVWMLAIEYEGRQHAENPRQFARDVERGYQGPAPLFARRWHSLFAPVRGGR
ncbi:hypothetical protein BHE97_08370 [Aeromicrobium sp. PE09-221]|uniref:hypothetical protein n=1 Tax=Aeromicrobium sp. PE09-221 TaxID=1898043 RepID=UPI000B3E69B0|nr:hypothetical protein [Aeromicrobium sp. PE09-221]OUZ10068.1 hypothetical protein BHE97_08370 [Aeromicrobium sp. PE09-221]